jgi:TRAP-type C4-dicarboxylate transport system permease small subunit
VPITALDPRCGVQAASGVRALGGFAEVMPGQQCVLKLTQVCDWINRLLVALTAILLFVMLIFSGVAIFSRYVLAAPLVWAGDIILAGFVWLCLLGISIAYRSMSHVSIDIVVNKLPEKFRSKLLLVTHLTILAFSTYLTIQGIHVVLVTTDMTFGALQWSPTYFYIAFPTAFSLIILFCIDNVLSIHRGIRLSRNIVSGE